MENVALPLLALQMVEFFLVVDQLASLFFSMTLQVRNKQQLVAQALQQNALMTAVLQLQISLY
jgi:hypothetical protein